MLLYLFNFRKVFFEGAWAKFGICTVVGLNGTLVEDNMHTFKGECKLFSFNKCPFSKCPFWNFNLQRKYIYTNLCCDSLLHNLIILFCVSCTVCRNTWGFFTQRILFSLLFIFISPPPSRGMNQRITNLRTKTFRPYLSIRLQKVKK